MRILKYWLLRLFSKTERVQSRSKDIDGLLNLYALVHNAVNPGPRVEFDLSPVSERHKRRLEDERRIVEGNG